MQVIGGNYYKHTCGEGTTWCVFAIGEGGWGSRALSIDDSGQNQTFLMQASSVSASSDSRWRARVEDFVGAARPGHWVKNLFVAASLVFTPAVFSLPSASLIALAITCFCLLSSAGYVMNDVVDQESDRLHPQKCCRAIASGRVSVIDAGALSASLFCGGLLLAYFLGFPFFWFALFYVVLSSSYSVWLKRFAVVDVIVIAIGFVVRVYAGAAIIDVTPSPWILLCTGLLALFIALAKRRDDLGRELSSQHRLSLAGYTKPFLDTTSTVVLAALLVAYTVYTTDTAVIAEKGTDKLYFTVPLVVAGIFRYLQITIVEGRSGEPVELAVRDPFLRWSILGWLLLFVGLTYT